MVEGLEGGMGEHATTGGIHGQASGGEPGGSVAAGAGQIRRLPFTRLRVKGDGGLSEETQGEALRGLRAQMEVGAPGQKAGVKAPGAKGEGHLHRGGAPTPQVRVGRGRILTPTQQGL
jgi:hypothetical protein